MNITLRLWYVALWLVSLDSLLEICLIYRTVECNSNSSGIRRISYRVGNDGHNEQKTIYLEIKRLEIKNY